MLFADRAGSLHSNLTRESESTWQVRPCGGSGWNLDIFTISRPAAQLSPALLRARHWYSPESSVTVFASTSSDGRCLIRPIASRYEGIK